MVSDVVAKYDAMAERYSELDYAAPEAYYARRARLLVAQPPPLQPGETVLDFACGDGGLGRHLLRLGLDYRGVDASSRMVEVARRALGDRVLQGSFDYVPPLPVAATTIYRTIYLVPKRRDFFARVRDFTQRKFVFDVDPRAEPVAAMVEELRETGWRQIRLTPFLTPQRGVLPSPLQRALHLLEPLPGARILTLIRFPLLVSAVP